MKKIGIIGGMSYESSIHYYERINDGVNKKLGGLTCAEMIIYNVNFAPIREKMLKNDWEGIKNSLIPVAKTLEKSGVDAIAIATNTIHKIADDLEKELSIPLIHIADCVSQKCLHDKKKKVGLLGTKYTMEEDFLKDRLKKNGLEIVIPKDKEEIEEINRIIFDELCKGKIKETSKKYYIDCINHMIKKDGIEGVILGCTEIEMLIKQEDITIPVYDTTQAHIDSLVEFITEERA